MSNLDIDDLWNIPKVNWHEPVSKEWEDIMKKKVFRERNSELNEFVTKMLKKELEQSLVATTPIPEKLDGYTITTEDLDINNTGVIIPNGKVVIKKTTKKKVGK